MAKTEHDAIEIIDGFIAQVASDLEDLREKRAVKVFQYDEKEDIIHRKINKLEQRWIKRRSNFKLHDYTEAMEKVNQKERLIPGMVINQQSSVCRSLHLMEVLEQDLDRLKDQNAEIIRFTQEQIIRLQEEKGKVEVAYLNKLCSKEAELEDVKEKQTKLFEGMGYELSEKGSTSTALTTESDDENEKELPILVNKPLQTRSFWRFLNRFEKEPSAFPFTASKDRTKRSRIKTSFAAPINRCREIKRCDREKMIEYINS
mmetsp:Transcript_4493/g.6483  ORF Transcript_4493/g.6483 Transcript_4493/m.6483 type:complete len:259 (-) Transcript_4493:156-932(-)